MKWAWAVILATGVLVGCRSAQPTANPFIRTTVPPPGTGQGAVVVPGEQYYPSGAPPVVTQGPTTAPPVVTPIAPPPPGTMPPPGAPPVVIPPKDRYSPPGGSFQYNQSSKDRRTPSTDPDRSGGQATLASYTAARPAAAENAAADDFSPNQSDAVNEAVSLAVESDPLAVSTQRERKARPSPEAIAVDARVEPRELRALADQEPRVAVDAMRILRGSNRDDEPVDDEPGAEPDAARDVASSVAAVEPRARSLAQPAARKLAPALDEAPDLPE